eukprot:Skav226421  [mRNA]  locus=scaffold4012:68569:73084:- [translate_table: standard]
MTFFAVLFAASFVWYGAGAPSAWNPNVGDDSRAACVSDGTCPDSMDEVAHVQIGIEPRCIKKTPGCTVESGQTSSIQATNDLVVGVSTGDPAASGEPARIS